MIRELLDRLLVPKGPVSTLCGCGRAPRKEPHDFVITSPEGYGTVLSPCSGEVLRGFTAPLGAGETISAQMSGPRSTPASS